MRRLYLIDRRQRIIGLMMMDYRLWTFDETRELIFYLLCYAPVLKFLTYYAQYYNVKDLCLKFGYFIHSLM